MWTIGALVETIGVSSNGKTEASNTSYVGSIPTAPANLN